MKVYGLVGKSGTGKSYQAISLCREMNIDSIIDDGLFIVGNRIIAGTSAKRQETQVKAIKTALFFEEDHWKNVKKKIREVQPNRILVLGTSERMVHRITSRLGLDEPEEIVHIDDITTEEDRRQAIKQRYELGKHVIPAPTFQLKKEFSGYFMHPIKLFKELMPGKSTYPERSVVRPTYSYLGRYTIYRKAIYDIISIAIKKSNIVESLVKVDADNGETGLVINIGAIFYYEDDLISNAKTFQREIESVVEDMTSFNMHSINIEIKGLRRRRFEKADNI